MSKMKRGKNLIFLISQPRAGSTLLQIMLASNNQIATCSEPWIALHPFFALHESGLGASYNSEIARNALLEFLGSIGEKPSLYKELVGELLGSLYEKALKYQGKKYFLDKTPRYYFIIDDLVDVFPDSKIIILFRNPLAVLNSIINTWVKTDISYLSNYLEDLMIAPQKMVSSLKKYPDHCTMVQYEDLVTSPEKVLKGICRFINVEYSADMLKYKSDQYKYWKLGDKSGVSKSNGPIMNCLNKWETGFSEPQLSLLATSYLEALGPNLINDMGYDSSEIQACLQHPCSSEDDNIISWDFITNIVISVSTLRDIRRAIFKSLLMNINSTSISAITPSYCIDHLEKSLPEILKLSIENLERQLKKTQIRADKLEKQRDRTMNQRDKLKNSLDSIRNTRTWRWTAPFRKSKIVKRLFN